MLVAVGGIGTPAGNVLWHVVGGEETIKEWSTVYRLAGHRLSKEMASGVLVGYLGGERQ
jgi:hypothetical protein